MGPERVERQLLDLQIHLAQIQMIQSSGEQMGLRFAWSESTALSDQCVLTRDIGTALLLPIEIRLVDIGHQRLSMIQPKRKEIHLL